ncbi:VENN motif pre-toxin domain-containing protein, partial [Salmonella enterica subsp. enterica serovar Sandiego]|nr:VENN motif pre-toxin domain-containing protein [Salmonella enterica subsp. enterica serovar Sandiego]EIT4523919.1 VENN motif pre-toxin domain-containing protein [Salmonella enterica subsp. enterica serovar Sandiego]
GVAGDSSANALAGAQAGKNAVENNALGDKDRLPVNIYDINQLKPGALDADGDPLKGGGGIAKYTINKGQQNKHIEGTNEYKTAAASSGSQRSILTVDPQSLLPQLGTGQQVGKVEVGLAGSKERIDFGKPIGNFVDRDTGLSVPTTKGIVHYGKDGAHIVPARP